MAKKTKEESVSLEERVQTLEEKMEMLEALLETAEPATEPKPSKWKRLAAWTKEKLHGVAVKAAEVTA